jgi:hypothetical protein
MLCFASDHAWILGMERPLQLQFIVCCPIGKATPISEWITSVSLECKMSLLTADNTRTEKEQWKKQS